MRINIKDRIVFVEKILWIEQDPNTKTVTFVFDGGIKLVADRVDFDKLKERLATNSGGSSSVKCTTKHDALFDRIFGRQCSFSHDID